MVWERIPVSGNRCIWHSPEGGYALGRFDESVGAWREPIAPTYTTLAHAIQALVDEGIPVRFTQRHVHVDVHGGSYWHDGNYDIRITWDHEEIARVEVACSKYDENGEPTEYVVSINGEVWMEKVTPEQLPTLTVEATINAVEYFLDEVLPNGDLSHDIVSTVIRATERRLPKLRRQAQRIIAQR